MNIKFFDAHSHLNFPQFDEDREEIIEEMKNHGIATICVGTDKKTSRESVELAKNNRNIWAVIGLHPTDTDEDFLEREYEALLYERVVGVGECGLDYFRGREKEKKQKDVFHSQIQFALKQNLPLMLHLRPSVGSMDAYTEGLDILESYSREYGDTLRGNSHFFVGDSAVAKRFLDLGFTMSFDGPITFSNEYDEVIRYIPDDMILAETDAPFAAPIPHRGKRNSPLYIEAIVERLSALKQREKDEYGKVLVDTTLRIFGI